MSPTETSKNSIDSSIVITHRTAIDSSGSIGWLYDAYRDCILGELNVKDKEKLYQSNKEAQCNIICCNNNQTQNLFRLLSMDEQLRLSILLKLAPDKGIASLINYSYATNGYTRLFCYSFVDKIQQLPDRIEDARAFIKQLRSDTKATHIITRVDWGIDFVVILELPFDTERTPMIDRVLGRIRILLLNDGQISTLTTNEEKLLESIIHTEVYSNIPDLYGVKTLRDVCRYIEQNKSSTVNYPVSYTLRPRKWLNQYYTGEGATFISLPIELNDNIEQYVLQFTADIKKLEISIYEDIPKLLYGHLKERLSSLQKQWLDVKKKHTNEIERLSKLVNDIRSGRVQVPTIDEALKKNEQISIKNSIGDLNQYLNDLEKKGKLITSLMKQQFQYYNVADYDIDRIDNEKIIERKLIINDQQDCILCSNDTLNKIKPTQLKNLRRDMVEEFENNSNLRLIYADFSYCSFELQNMMKLPSNKYENEQNKPKQKETASFRDLQTTTSPSIKAQTSLSPPAETQTSAPASTKLQITDSLSTKTQTYTSSQTKPQTYITSFAETQTFTPQPTEAQITGLLFTKPQPSLPPFTEVQNHVSTSTKSQNSVSSLTKAPTYMSPSTETHNPRSSSTSLSDTEIINILLLGETGVGKSTFINALANYLTFDTLQQAERSQPIVLIPVSFLMTVGDNFEEYIVKFGDLDGLKNEDFEHPGQSVTQRCKSYNFRLNPNNRKILRIIDTPGFGDTRGVDQDDRNMEHILEYIKNLSHLDAVCFLLKPNESRLNLFFRSCLTQLFSLLGRNIGDNIIFCFTNSRSTFYTPGDTAPLLKKMLTSLPIGNVPFRKDNIFCFDSESFRYLVALQNQIQFNSLEKREYETSWAKSVTDASRLIRYIRTNLTSYLITNKR